MATVEIPTWTNARARIGALSRSRLHDDPELVAARQDLRAARLADHIRETVAGAPALTDEQLDALTALFRAPVEAGS